MEALFFIIFLGIIIANFSKGSKKKPPAVKTRSIPGQVGSSSSQARSGQTISGQAISGQAMSGATQSWTRDLQKINSAKQSAQAGSATLARYKKEQRKRYKAQAKSNSGLWLSKHRVDKNRRRRTDWGARGDSALFSPQMIGIIGGVFLTLYLAVTALNG